MMVITRPSYDDTTKYLHELSKEVISIARERGHQVIDLQNERSTKKEFESVLSKKNPRLIFLNGHGNSKIVTGNKKTEILLEEGKNEDITKSKIVYARACRSLSDLGKSCVKNGKAEAYIGYNDDFVFLTDDNKISTPQDDEIAKPFIEASNMIPISLLKGNTVKESVDKSNLKSQKLIEYFMTYDSPESPLIIQFLRWNMLIRGFCGDGYATI